MQHQDAQRTDGQSAANLLGRISHRLGLALSAAALGVGIAATPACDEGGDGSGNNGGPLYAITSVFVGTEGRTSYVATFGSLDVDTVDVRSGIEFPGNIVVESYGGALYVGLAESPELVRYEPDQSGVLIETGRMSFASRGFTRYPFGSVIANAHRAFAIDSATLQIVAWDPTSMTIVDELDIGGFTKSGFSPEFWTSSVHDSRLYVPVRYANWDQGAIDDSVVLAIYDVETLDLVGVAEDSRCASGGRPVFASNGDAYVVADGRNWSRQLFAHVGHQTIPSNCILRIEAGQTDFDADYYVETRSLLGDDAGVEGLLPEIATEAIPPTANGGVGFLQVFDPNLLPSSATVGADFAFWGQPAFPHYRFTVGDAPKLEIVGGIEPSVLGWAGSVTDGGVFVCRGTSHEGCTVYELDESTNAATPLFAVEGAMSNLTRLR